MVSSKLGWATLPFWQSICQHANNLRFLITAVKKIGSGGGELLVGREFAQPTSIVTAAALA
jgi:hypothetical protein